MGRIKKNIHTVNIFKKGCFCIRHFGMNISNTFTYVYSGIKNSVVTNHVFVMTVYNIMCYDLRQSIYTCDLKKIKIANRKVSRQVLRKSPQSRGSFRRWRGAVCWEIKYLFSSSATHTSQKLLTHILYTFATSEINIIF